MAKLLYVESSPRKERSASITIARHFVDTYEKTHPGDTSETIDLWQYDLPEFNNETLAAKYGVLSGDDLTPDQASAWNNVKLVFDQFNSGDKYLLSVPMWNFGVPYRLKHYVDVITQPGMAFGPTPDGGMSGLITDRPATVVYARGGQYPAGSPMEAFDVQRLFMSTWLGFIGFTDIQSIVIEPTMDCARRDEVMDAAREQARTIARSY